MILLYCRGKHGQQDLCQRCAELLAYAQKRIERCPYEEKPVCNSCPTHCYKPEFREEIRRVMRYAGPKMPFYHPVQAILHLLDARRGDSGRIVPPAAVPPSAGPKGAAAGEAGTKKTGGPLPRDAADRLPGGTADRRRNG